jgi:FkbH-like protein
MIIETNFNTLKKKVKEDFSKFPKYKVAVLGESSTQHLVMAIRGYGYINNQNLDIYEADIDQLDIQILTPDSELYEFNPEYVVIIPSVKKIYKNFCSYSLEQKKTTAENYLHNYSNLINVLDSKGIKVIIGNLPEINDNVFGNYSNKVEVSLLYQLRKFNYELMNFSRNTTNTYIIDINSICFTHGWNNLFSSNLYVNSDVIFNFNAMPLIAANISSIINAAKGKLKKCVVLDLDNTLWGGIIGDDGIDKIEIGNLGIGKAFSEFQKWLLCLKQRGIILCVCSKNEEKVAKEPFISHPDMTLRLDDISVFVANWNSKAENIKYIQKVLNIGFDSMVFFDDNPFERNLVKTMIPDITVPELPADPAEYLNFLTQLNLFETVSFSNEDLERTKQYQQEAERTAVKLQFSDENDFLSSLEMVSEVSSLNKYNIPRIAQLSQRSNQFNLRTVRYTESDLIKMSEMNGIYFPLAFNLKDKFGDYGLITVVILKKEANTLFIENWFMSCRVLKRGMEDFTLNSIINLARENAIETIIGEYIPTSKNEMVANHYLNLGFISNNGKWLINIIDYKEKDTKIKTLNI